MIMYTHEQLKIRTPREADTVRELRPEDSVFGSVADRSDDHPTSQLVIVAVTASSASRFAQPGQQSPVQLFTLASHGIFAA